MDIFLVQNPCLQKRWELRLIKHQMWKLIWSHSRTLGVQFFRAQNEGETEPPLPTKECQTRVHFVSRIPNPFCQHLLTVVFFPPNDCFRIFSLAAFWYLFPAGLISAVWKRVSRDRGCSDLVGQPHNTRTVLQAATFHEEERLNYKRHPFSKPWRIECQNELPERPNHSVWPTNHRTLTFAARTAINEESSLTFRKNLLIGQK